MVRQKLIKNTPPASFAHTQLSSLTLATFVQTDTTTQGNWKGVYGSDGYNVINDAVSYPAYAQVSVSGQSAYTWAASTTDVRALLKAASATDRLAACWYSGSNFTVDVNLMDGNVHRVAVYSLDWDGNNTRQERIEVLDAGTNAVLDSRDVTSYAGGKYSVWDLRGHVKIKVTHLAPAGSNAVISGLFLGPAQQNVSWTNVSSTITVTANSIQKTSGTNAWDAGAVSTQTIASGNGYVDFVPGENVTWRMCGLGNGDSSTYYSDIEYAFFMDGGGGLSIYESGTYGGAFGAYAASDHLKVAVENGVVNYYRNATLLYTSTVTPQYPLLVDTSLNTVGAGVYNVVIAGTAPSSTGAIQWLVTDQLGTPRMVFDKTGALANVKRHDYLPFGEELSSAAGLRSSSQGYGVADGIRQKFTSQERDNETGLDYMHARYFASAQGRFTGADSVAGSIGNPQSLNRYAYVNNNPMNFTDPTGHMPSIHLNPTPVNNSGYEGGGYSWDDPTSPQAVLQAAGILPSDVIGSTQINDFSSGPQAKSGSTAYAGDGIVQSGAGETSDQGASAAGSSSSGVVAVTDASLGSPQDPVTVTAAGEPPRTGEIVSQMNTVSEQQVREFNGSTCVGKSCDCVPLVKALTGTMDVSTTRWREGEAALGNASLPYGTPIATFVNGRYPSLPTGNHGAFLLYQEPRGRAHPSGGIWVLDQYASRGRIGIRLIENRNGRGSPSNDASRFSVIWIAPLPETRRR